MQERLLEPKSSRSLLRQRPAFVCHHNVHLVFIDQNLHALSMAISRRVPDDTFPLLVYSVRIGPQFDQHVN